LAYSQNCSSLSWLHLSMRPWRSWKAAFESVKAHVEVADVHAVVEGRGLQRECCLKSPWYPQNS
jgi:hypothetical protein